MFRLLFTAVAIALGIQQLAAQTQPSKITIEYADFADRNEIEMPGAALLQGNVRAQHNGVLLYCNKAYFFENENYLKAFGNVRIVQGDTLTLHGKYAEYNGNTLQAFTIGEVVMQSPTMRMTTDTLYYDRQSQMAYYRSGAVIHQGENVLTSKNGRYYVGSKKLSFTTAVEVKNPKYTLNSNHLDYYTNSGHAYLFGPSTITSAHNYIYTERGFYDNKRNRGHFLNNSYIRYNDREIKGDSLYYDRVRDFASATNNITITDTVNRMLIRGHYGEVYRQKDSMYITQKALATTWEANSTDSLYVHGKTLTITGKAGERTIKAGPNARIFRTDMSGKCDQIVSTETNGITRLIGRPVLWNGESQLTGDEMHLISETESKQLDSLKVLNNAFLISRDTLGTGYNQMKGTYLYGKFRENQLRQIDIVKNAEIIYYMRDEDGQLIGIDKSASSSIEITMADNQIETVTQHNQISAETFPESMFPENSRKFRGFNWRGDERIARLEDLFPEEELAHDKAVDDQKAAYEQAGESPLPVRKETEEYDLQSTSRKTPPQTTKTKK